MSSPLGQVLFNAGQSASGTLGLAAGVATPLAFLSYFIPTIAPQSMKDSGRNVSDDDAVAKVSVSYVNIVSCLTSRYVVEAGGVVLHQLAHMPALAKHINLERTVTVLRQCVGLARITTVVLSILIVMSAIKDWKNDNEASLMMLDHNEGDYSLNSYQICVISAISGIANAALLAKNLIL